MENNYSNVQLNFNQESGDISFRSEKEGSIYFLGLLAICCATLTSGFAGVYNEKLIKNGQQPSLLIRSIQLSKYPFFLLITQMSIFSFSFFRFVFCFLRLFRRSSKRR
jgi:Nucleotide-sugar transporter